MSFFSPKFYGPLAIWPWLKISPQSSLNVIYLIITAWQWLMNFPYMPCIPMQTKPIKACQGKGRGAFSLREWLCCPFSSTGRGSPCEFVLSQPQCHGHCLPVATSKSHILTVPKLNFKNNFLVLEQKTPFFCASKNSPYLTLVNK